MFDGAGYLCDTYIMKDEKPILNISEIYPYSWKVDDFIVRNVKSIVSGELRYCDPHDEACCESAQRNLDSIIDSLILLREEVEAHQRVEVEEDQHNNLMKEEPKLKKLNL